MESDNEEKGSRRQSTVIPFHILYIYPTRFKGNTYKKHTITSSVKDHMNKIYKTTQGFLMSEITKYMYSSWP